MYCSECHCEFSGWRGRCPVCKASLIDAAPPEHLEAEEPLFYDELVDSVRRNNGEIIIDLSTREFARVKRWRFPYFGFGFGWEKHMQGEVDDMHVDLRSSEVGTQRKWSFPWLGYGFAWVKRMQGHIGGNPVVLTAKKVAREKKGGFPFFGYGRAWTEVMVGDCGDRLKIKLVATEVRKKRKNEFPYRGYSFAWVDKSRLTISLK